MANLTDTQSLDRSDTITGFAGGQTILGRYSLGRVLGQGGMGIVWLARDEKLNRDVALKFLPDIVVNDRASLNDLIRETRRSLELTHPNIVRTYDFVQDNSIAGISMEYVDSDTLRNLRIDQPNGVFEPSQVGEWVKQLCAALAYAHTEAAIVHRDLKPANLMINGKGQLKVADFGIARSLVESVSQITMQNNASGTLVYMSPQQLSGDTASPLDDIYAIGATLYELFTTRPPFYSGDIAGQVRTKIAPSIAQRRTSLSIPVAEFPAVWEETIAACLSKDPAQRPQSAAEVAVRLGLLDAASLPAPSPARTAAAVSAAPTPAYSTATAPLTVGALPSKFNPRRWLIGAGAAALLLSLLTAGVVWSNHYKQEQARQELVRQEQARQERARLEAEHLANARGSLLIRTHPSGATVTLGDQPPVQTPAPIQDLKLGEQTYKIELEGYDPYTGFAKVEENRIVKPDVVNLIPSVGAIQIHSQPEGLAFELRSKSNPMNVVRGATPQTVPSVPVGAYEVTVTREGWKPLTEPAQVRRGQEENKTLKFLGGTVTLKSEPPGAKIELNGKDLGVTPKQFADIPPGPVSYTLQLAGYDKAVAAGTVTAGEELPLQPTLHKTAVAVASRPRTVSSGRSRSSSSGRSSGGGREEGSGSDTALKWIRAFSGR
jgi:hypothetical protein